MSEAAVVPASRGRILVVDDERKNRQLLQVILAAEGYAVELAESGDEALAKVAASPPDLVLLDIMMPGMSGYEVVARLKGAAGTRQVHVVMLSALDDRNSRAQGITVGADAYLTKPVNRVELCALVASLLTAVA